MAQGVTSAPSRKGSLLRGTILVLVGATCWGINGTISQELMQGYGVDPVWLTCVKQLGSFWLFLVAARLATPEQFSGAVRSPRALLGMLVTAISTIVLLQVAYMNAIRWTNSGTATVLQSLNLLFVLAYVCVSSRRMPKSREVVGVVLAFVGTFLIATGGNPGALTLPLMGLVWGILTAVGQSLLSIQPVRLIQRWGILVVNGFAFLFAGLLLALFARPWECLPALDTRGVALLVLSILVGTFGAYLFYMNGLKEVGSMRATLLGTAEPVVATVTSVLFLGTVFTPTDVAGFALIIAMVFLTA